MKHRMRKLQVAVSLSIMLALVVVGMVSAVAPFTIDHFGGSQDFTVVYTALTAPNVGFDWVDDANALGGQRDILATIASASTDGQQLHITVNETNDGRLTVTSGTDMQYSVQIQWDGTEGGTGSSAINTTGLTGVNLSSGGKDRFLLGIPASDQSGRITIQVYGDATHCSELFVDTDAGIGGLAAKVYELEYASFAPCSSYTATDFSSNVGAVALTLSTRASGASWDVSLHLAAAGTFDYKDYGDLPQGSKSGLTYRYENLTGSTTVLAEAYHIDTGLTLGPSLTTEETNVPNLVTADTDTDNGVTATGGSWTVGVGGGHVTVLVSGCPAADCYLNAFIDWNKDRDFWYLAGDAFDSGEQVLSNYVVHNGSNALIPINIPVGTTIAGQSFHARFRLTEEKGAIGGSPWGAYFSGEVEDYRWTFGTTAVTLAKLDATSSSASSALPFAALLLPVGLGMLLVSRRRK